MINRVIFLSIVAAIGVISASLCAPALPHIADHFSADFTYIQFTISLFLIGNAFGQFVSGPLSDQIGQRKVLLGGLFLYLLASCGCALSTQMSFLLTSRFFQGMGSAVGPVLARAIASNSFSQTKSAQVQSYGAIGVGVATILSVLCSGQLTLYSWRGNFWFAAALGVLLILWTLRALKQEDAPKEKALSLKQSFQQMRWVMTHKDFISHAFCHAMAYGLMYGYISLFPFLLIEFFQKKDPTQVSMHSSYMIITYMLGAYVASQLVVKYSSVRLAVSGVLMQLAAGFFLMLSTTPVASLLSLVLFNFGLGLILPMTVAAALAPFVGQAAGTASSTLGLSYRFIGSLLSTLICYLPIAGGKNLGLSILLLSTLSLAVFKFASNRRPIATPTAEVG